MGIAPPGWLPHPTPQGDTSGDLCPVVHVDETGRVLQVEGVTGRGLNVTGNLRECGFD